MNQTPFKDKIVRSTRRFARRVLLAAKPSRPQLCRIAQVRLALDLSQPVHRSIYVAGHHEKEVACILERVTQPGDVFVDIGANIGWHTLALLVKRPDVCMAYAFEPVQRNFDCLLLGIRANQCNNRCEARMSAVGSSNGSMRLRKFEGLDLMHTSAYPLADLPYEEEEVTLVTLDSATKTFVAVPNVIKCDVEGGERGVLRGATALLGGKYGTPPLWFMEANYETSAMAGYFPSELIECAGQFGYKAYTIRGGSLVPSKDSRSFRHGDVFVLGIPDVHQARLAAVQVN